jgi:hypothetical protein
MRKQAVSQMQNEYEANVAAFFRIPNLLAESFVNKKLLRISEDRLHLRPFSRYQASIQISISATYLYLRAEQWRGSALRHPQTLQRIRVLSEFFKLGKEALSNIPTATIF